MSDNSKFKPALQIIRAFIYSACISFIFFLLLNIELINDSNLFGEVAFLGFLIALLEAYFTSRYLNLGRKQHFKYHFSEHLLNHLYYPFLTFFALAFYFLLQTNFTLSYVLIALSFLMYWAYFYYLPLHIHFDHFDVNKNHKIHPRTDFTLHLFKFFSYFVANLTLFTYYFYSKISFDIVVYINFSLNFIFLLFHIFRKNMFNGLNIFMAFLFAVITSFFTLTFKSSYINLSASVATLFFYLTSAIYYHKVDGTFNYKVLIEYGSIATIVSILLFSIR